MGKNNKKLEYSLDNHNLEVVEDNVPLLEKEEAGKKTAKISVFNFYINNNYSQGFKDRKKFWYIFMLLSVCVAAAGFFYYHTLSYKDKLLIDFTSDTSEIISGDESVFRLKYFNDNCDNYENVNIKLSIPENFKVNSVEPGSTYDRQTSVLKLGDVKKGDYGEIVFRGKVLGEINSDIKFLYILKYKKNGSDFTGMNYSIFNINKSVIELSVDMPQLIYQDAEFPFTVNVQNNGQEKNNITLGFGNLIIAKEMETNNNKLLEEIEPGGSVKLDYRGKIQNIKNNKVAVRSYVIADKKRMMQDVSESEIEYAARPLDISVITQKQTSENSVELKIKFKNTSDKTLDDIGTSIFENNKKSYISIKKSEAIIVGRDYFTISKLDPNKEIEIRALVISDLDSKSKISFKIESNYKIDGQKIIQENTTGEILICSKPKVNIAAYYYNQYGDQIGSGPLPPVVGLPTNYWIFWEISNPGNDAKEFIVSAEIPANVLWLDSENVLAGSLEYDDKQRKITWIVNDLTAQYLKTGFQISLIPSKDQVGQRGILLQNIKYTANNFNCYDVSEVMAGSIDTKLIYDKSANNKEIIQK